MKSPERKLSERGLKRINDCNDSHVDMQGDVGLFVLIF